MKNYSFTILLIFAFVCSLSFSSSAQIKMPAPSPLATVTQEVGLMEIKIVYSRPGSKGRKIYGDLVPFGKSWRTGANSSTKISFTDEVTIKGNKVPAGEYALFTIPGEREWTIILHKNTNLMGTGGDNYKQEEEAARFTVPTKSLAEPVETFTISVDNISMNSADVSIAWEKTAVTFTVETEIDSQIMANIDQSLKSIDQNNGNLYFQAATYYYETGKDLNKAHEWVNKAVSSNPKAYWMAHLKAKILAKQDKKKEAIEAAETAKKIAQEGNNADYVRLNDKLIKELKKK